MEKCAIIFKMTVVNIVMGVEEACDVIAKEIYGQEAMAASTRHLDIHIGDRYIDGTFYRHKDHDWVPLGGAE